MADDKFNAAFAPKKSGGSPAAAANKAPAKADARSDPKADAKAARKAKKKRSRKVLMLCLLIIAILLGGAGYALYRIGMLDPILVAVGMIPIAEAETIEIQVRIPAAEPQTTWWDELVWFVDGLIE